MMVWAKPQNFFRVVVEKVMPLYLILSADEARFFFKDTTDEHLLDEPCRSCLLWKPKPPYPLCIGIKSLSLARLTVVVATIFFT